VLRRGHGGPVRPRASRPSTDAPLECRERAATGVPADGQHLVACTARTGCRYVRSRDR
jgi:hypothetical protein